MPIITTAVLTTIITTLANKGLESAFENVGEKVSDGAIDWIKSLFYKEGKPKKALRELQENPVKIEKREIVKAIIENSIEDNPIHSKYLKEIIEILPKNENIISNYKNINTGKIETKGGDVHIGDNYDR
ncbi:MAG TPA: hypothetical protein ENK46_00755 [Flavobacteriia bacterium]|nr:hypothetical protein [Flavobacteriia bacterium]